MRLPVSKPRDSKLVLQLCVPLKLRGRSDVDRDIKNNKNPHFSHFDILKDGGKIAIRIPVAANIIP